MNKKNILNLFIISFFLFSLSNGMVRANEISTDFNFKINNQDNTYNGSTFSEVWNILKSDPYGELPQGRVTFKSFFSWGKNKLLSSSKRTIDDRSDIIPYFTKLLHPNGVALSGTWNIVKENPYSGFFSNGSKGLIIARSSTTLSETERGNLRGFGLAGKIYPTLDPDEKVVTANFFTIDDLVGTKAEHYTDVAMTNEPTITLRPQHIWLSKIFTAVGISLGQADSSPNIRQLYQISELAMEFPEDALTPKWMKIQASAGQVKVDEIDFRDELNLLNYPDHKLYFDIYVTTPDSTKSNKEWIYIGYIEFDDYVASESTDHRLHFNHPRLKTIRTK